MNAVKSWAKGLYVGAEKAAVSAAITFVTVSGTAYIATHDWQAFLVGLGSAVLSGVAVALKNETPKP